MRFCSDDGKMIGSVEEVKEYEEKQNNERAAKAEAARKTENAWSKVEKCINDLNESVDEFKAISGQNIVITESLSGHLNAHQTRRPEIDIDRLVKMFF